MSSSGESSPVPSPEPENVACYEECITDEIFIPSAAAGEPSESSASLQLATSPQHGIPKVSTSGRVAKRGNKILLNLTTTAVLHTLLLLLYVVRSRPKSLKNRKCSSPLILQW